MSDNTFTRITIQASRACIGNGQLALRRPTARPMKRLLEIARAADPPPVGPVRVASVINGIDDDGTPTATLALGMLSHCQNAPLVGPNGAGVAAATGGSLATLDSAPIHKARVQRNQERAAQAQQPKKLGRLIPRRSPY